MSAYGRLAQNAPEGVISRRCRSWLRSSRLTAWPSLDPPRLRTQRTDQKQMATRAAWRSSWRRSHGRGHQQRRRDDSSFWAGRCQPASEQHAERLHRVRRLTSRAQVENGAGAKADRARRLGGACVRQDPTVPAWLRFHAGADKLSGPHRSIAAARRHRRSIACSRASRHRGRQPAFDCRCRTREVGTRGSDRAS